MFMTWKAKLTLTNRRACKGSEGVNMQPERPGGTNPILELRSWFSQSPHDREYLHGSFLV